MPKAPLPTRALAPLLGGLFLCVTAGAALADTASKNNEGNRLYNEKRYDDALKKYTDAQASRPNSSELHYNIGNVLFRKGEFAKAIEEYLRAQSGGGRALSQAATFNRGNALMMQGQIQDAINAYVQALRADPADQDAKRNLELALRLLQQQKQPPQQDDQQQDQKPDQDNQPPPPQPQDQQARDEKRPPERRPGQMSEEEARQILDALREAEKDGVKKHAQAAAPHAPAPEEDW
jgi:tetratricopeptide (TPR) repeat protein